MTLRLPPIREAPTQNSAEVVNQLDPHGSVQTPTGHNLTSRQSRSTQEVINSHGFAKQTLTFPHRANESPDPSTSGPVLPRTYYTRKGALMLYADTITLPPLIDSQRSRRTEETEDPNGGFNSVSSLVRDILHYGSTV